MGCDKSLPILTSLILGHSSNKLLRIGNALRLSDPSVEPWLPKPTINSTKYYEELASTRNSMMKLGKKYGKKFLIEQEEELQKKLRLLRTIFDQGFGQEYKRIQDRPTELQVLFSALEFAISSRRDCFRTSLVESFQDSYISELIKP